MRSSTLNTLTDNTVRRTVSLALAAVTLVTSLGATCAVSSVYAVAADASSAPLPSAVPSGLAPAATPAATPAAATTRFPSHCDMATMPADPAAAAAMAMSMAAMPSSAACPEPSATTGASAQTSSEPGSGHWCAHKDRDDASGPSDGPAQPALVSSLTVSADLADVSSAAACAVVADAADPPPVTFSLPIRI